MPESGSRSRSRSKSKSKSRSKKIKFALRKEDTKTYLFFNDAVRDDEFLEETKMIAETEYAVYPEENDPKNRIYRQICRYIYDKIKKVESLCNGLNPSYVLSALKQANVVIVVGPSHMDVLPNGGVYAVAMVKFDERTNSMYLDVICSNNGIQGAGQILMKEIDRVAKLTFITKITLNSVFSAIAFYEKQGFVKTGRCDDENELCEMKKTLR